MLIDNKEKKINKDDIGELSQSELNLIFYIRNRFRFGDITIVVRDGKPFRIIKAFESTDLT